MENSGVDDCRDINRANRDERAPAHAASPDDNLQGFLDDPTFISEVVRCDRPLLGEVSGLREVHLQCHIGTDTISLSRLGARMTEDEVSVVESDVSKDDHGQWRLTDRPWRLPAGYTLQAAKPRDGDSQ